MKTTMESNTDRIADLEHQVSCLKQELGQDHIHLDAVNKKVDTLRADMERMLKSNLDAIAKDARKQEKEMNELREYCLQYTAKVESLHTRIDELWLIVGKMGNGCCDLTKKVNKLITEINMLFEQVKAQNLRILMLEEKLVGDCVIVPKNLVDYEVGENNVD